MAIPQGNGAAENITGANITGADSKTAQYISEVWTKEIQKPFYNTLQFAKLVTRRDGLVAGGGDTINIPFMDTLAVRDKVASTPVIYDNDMGTPITVAINKHKYSAVLIEDFAKVQSNYNLQSEFRAAQAETVSRAIDTDLAALYAGADTTVSAGSSVSDSEVLQVVQALDGANVPRSQRYGVIHSEAHTSLLNVNKYTTYDQTGNKGVAVTDGLVSRIYGFELYMSNNVALEDSSPDLLHNLFFHKKGISLALQLKPTYKMEDSVDHIGMKTVLHTLYGVKVERPEAVVDLTLNT